VIRLVDGKSIWQCIKPSCPGFESQRSWSWIWAIGASGSKTGYSLIVSMTFPVDIQLVRESIKFLQYWMRSQLIFIHFKGE